MSQQLSNILTEAGTNEVEVLVFHLNGGLYGVNVAKVREIITMVPLTALPDSDPAVRGVFSLREQVHPLVDLRKFFSMPLFLLSLRAGGFGLNLTRANHVFHFDRWWNPAVEEQATDRAHRIGQTRRVQVHKFVCIGTIEDRIDQLLMEKSALSDQIVGSGDEWLTGLSTTELREYLTLKDDQDACRPRHA